MEQMPPIAGTTGLDLQLRDKMFVEECLGAHMLVLMVEQAQRERNLQIRSDFMQNLQVSSVVALRPLDEISISRIARKTDEAGSVLLRDLKKIDYLDAAYATAMFNLKLVEMGLDPDPQRISVCLSMLLLEDVKDTNLDDAGASALMDLRETSWQNSARDMILRAQVMGLYLPQTVALRAKMLSRKRAAIAEKRDRLVSEKPRRAAGGEGFKSIRNARDRQRHR